jgi:nicotinamide mononucleotide adenylyltransferase
MDLGKKIFVIYPGRFHPFHKGHKGVYNYLSSKYGGKDVYITTTDVVELPKSPFSFDEKVKMMTLTGVPINKIIQVRQNYNLTDIESKIPIDINRDSIIFAVSEKDMAEEPRFSKFTKKDGSPSYLQPLPKRIDKLEPAIKHGYIDTVPTTDFTVLGMPARSASQLRTQYATLSLKQRKLFISDLFGKYNDDVYNILNSNLSTDTQLTERQKSILKKLIVGVIKEDQSKVDAAKKIANLAFKKQREEELQFSREKLDKAEIRLKNATDEEKQNAEKEVEKAKNDVRSKEELYKAATAQTKS